MVQVLNPDILEPAALRQREARGTSTTPATAPERQHDPDDVVLDHYLQRLDRGIAETFTEDQREAVKILLGIRGIARHTIELRRSVPFGRRRFYFVFLFGRERRGFSRLFSQGMNSRRFNILLYLGIGIFCLMPLFLLLISSLN